MRKDAQDIDINKIRDNGGSQTRAALDEETIREYAEAMEAGATFPPIVVFYDGEKYWLADGFHRRKAAMNLRRATIAADIRQGTLRDAVLCSVGANASHGLRRTNADKRRAVVLLLSDAEWSGWSDREIARRCEVHHSFVSRLRETISPSPGDSEGVRQFVTRHGTPATMKTANIGRTPSMSDDEWDGVRKHLAEARESKSDLMDEWLENGDGGPTENVHGDIQTEINEVLRALSSPRHDPLVAYRRWWNARKLAREQGRDLSEFLFDRTEEEITDAIHQRVDGKYPRIDEEEERRYAEEQGQRAEAAHQEQRQRAEAAYQAARPYGSLKECMELFERIGLALVRHPDILPHHERDVKRLCHRIIETGFGFAEPTAATKKGARAK